jgi:hypothetical protein
MRQNDNTHDAPDSSSGARQITGLVCSGHLLVSGKKADCRNVFAVRTAAPRVTIFTGKTTMNKQPRATYDPEYIRDLSERVYRLRLEQDSAGNVARMIEKDEDGGEKLRNRAGSYDALTRAYLKVFGFEPDGVNDRPSLLSLQAQRDAT